MRRIDFIKLNVLAGFGWSVLPIQDLIKNPSQAFLTGKHNPYLNTSKIMHKTAYQPFVEMHEAALKEGIDIQIASGFRSFNRQLQIWNKKYKQYQKQNLSDKDIIKQIITYSTIPGTSRHHWGTDIDIVDANVEKPNGDLLLDQNYHGNGVYCKLHEWMQTHAHKFGFYLVYTNNYHRTGFKYEPWHYSYKPLSKDYLKAYLKLNPNNLFVDIDIQGKAFLDKNCLMSYFETHLQGINPLLLP
ncbi:M15 family metallopeptidase [Flavobacterium sp. CS20]|uniref:M15 family metallopeptidase n=1 Tax=Flavobacterium sp. CS20 TaxID=2775246 RepID=UPI001B3A55E5|nr:M15 family metallopeptidase [Flavobacterium sp. CS20]QTY27163.1 M15 family metallopeptidase [Flavobacterium sp. CS20]